MEEIKIQMPPSPSSSIESMVVPLLVHIGRQDVDKDTSELLLYAYNTVSKRKSACVLVNC